MIIKHGKPNWDECCSCCPILEKNNKELITNNIRLQDELDTLAIAYEKLSRTTN